MQIKDPRLPSVFGYREAAAAGMTRSAIQRRVAAGHWRRLRRGAFCLTPTWDTADPTEQYRLLSMAAARVMPEGHVISHTSAAAMHKLPMPRRRGPAWLTAPPGTPTRYLDGLVVEAASVPDVDRWLFDDMPTTSPARTVADCLRHLDVIDAVAIADAALHSTPGLGGHVSRVLGQCSTWPYVARAYRAVPFIDSRRESFAESWSYVVMHLWHVPVPEPQVQVHDSGGTLVARVDALWQEQGLVGEVDGLVKYGVGTELPLEEARRVVIAEKERERALTDLGLRVIRWGTKDLRRPRDFADWIRHEVSRPAGAVTARFSYLPDLPLLTGSPGKALPPGEPVSNR